MFRILQFEIIRHNFFQAQKFNFINDLDYSSGPYTTMLIGPNGTGKSQLLELLIKIFNIIISSQEQGQKIQNFDFDFELTYRIENNLAQIRCVRGKDVYKVNNEDCNLNDLPTPAKILASAINLNDRFPFYTSRSKAKNTKYEYLGIRTASNNAFKNYNTLIDRFSYSLVNEENIEKYRKIFDQIGLKPEITITYKAGKNLTLNKLSNGQNYSNDPLLLAEKFQSIIEKLDRPGRFSIRKDRYQKVISHPENLQLIVNFLVNKIDLQIPRKGLIKYNSHTKFDNLQEVHYFRDEAQSLQLLRELELLDVDKLILHRKEGSYGFDQASSGEYHILSSFINIISTIKPNSLVLIDEPEISLHPNWQIQYMSLLQKTFTKYSNCHFIISTHSHFLVSDLEPEKSAIISFHSDNNGRIFNETLEYETTGWSAENVLYRVFGVSTVRNYYLEMDLRDLLSKISNGSKDFKHMNEILDRLKKFDLTIDDPLTQIIQTAEGYLDNHGN
ncbi:AAA family ATPase [Flavobacterium sp. JAS]|uniref:AAA family ATPase n=1 Tax=Flavobacterium sp. JAS TaxID=2897329 RepID=UPI001E54C4C7|nr:AAA family ATPase [Flavobacterium sp. JAS]MCD0470729.1 ATP-binding protein [Flavobacterium sp. JAS]